MRSRKQKLDLERAEAIALSGLAFLAEDGERLGRFLRLTGIDPQDLMANAGSAATLAAVLEHLLSDESMLLVFAASKGVAPEDIAPAHWLISGSPRS